MPYNYKTELQRYRRYYQSLEPILGKAKSQNYTAVVFSFLAVSLFGWYAIRPTIQTIIMLRREIQDKTEISRKMEDKIGALIEAQAAYSQAEKFLPAVSEAMPGSPEGIPLIIQLRTLADSAGVAFKAVQMPALPLLGTQATASATSKAASTGKQQSFEFSISVTGDYSAIQTFLLGLIEMRRVVIINSISVIPDKAEEPSASPSGLPAGQQLQLSITLTSFYLTE